MSDDWQPKCSCRLHAAVSEDVHARIRAGALVAMSKATSTIFPRLVGPGRKLAFQIISWEIGKGALEQPPGILDWYGTVFRALFGSRRKLQPAWCFRISFGA